MLIPPIGRGRVYDLLHKWTVSVCMGASVFAIVIIGVEVTTRRQAALNNSSESESVEEKNLQDTVMSNSNLQNA